MTRTKNTQGSALPITLLASALVGLLGMSSMLLLSSKTTETTQMIITPNTLEIVDGSVFKIEIIVSSTWPVNAFAGVLEFDETVLAVDHIEYNTSIADLWAVEPWFNRGSGKISFAGGSTRSGGFTGSGSLITVYFKGKVATNTTLKLSDTRVLQHDGLGTDATLTASIDALFTITANQTNLTTGSDTRPTPTTDLSRDGKTTIADISIFMLNLTTQNLQADFNNDGKVGTADLSILLDARN